jgi:phosphatidylglycerol:prolipoprotein diacylglycerol transferase
MTVYPLVIHLGPLEITGFGIMIATGFLMGGWVIHLELGRRDLNTEYASDIVLGAVVGGLLGAKLWYVGLTQDLGALLSRGGLVWYGGFLGGCVGVLFMGWFRQVPTRLTLELTAPALTVGYALGRVGCFLVGDDYGMPTSLPWAMKFPQGLPRSTAANLSARFGVEIPQGVLPSEVLAVHPTQLYEVAAMLLVFGLLWRLRTHQHGTGWLFGLYLLLAATERFLVEILRAKDDRFFGSFTIAQLTSLAVATVGVTLMARWREAAAVRIPERSVLLQKGS